MVRHVIVSFGEKNEYEFKVSSADLAGQTTEAARSWLDREFVALECDMPNPIGKVLLADLVLCVAKYGGEQRFRERGDWAQQFAKSSAALLASNVIRVDVENSSVGF